MATTVQQDQDDNVIGSAEGLLKDTTIAAQNYPRMDYGKGHTQSAKKANLYCLTL